MPTPLADAFADLPDPRRDRGQKHSLADILAIALCAVIAGATLWEEVERFGRAKRGWLKTFLALPNGIPEATTPSHRLFTRLDPAAFARCVTGWLAGACEATGLRHVAIDGKACRSAPPGHVQRVTRTGRSTPVSTCGGTRRRDLRPVRCRKRTPL